MTEQKRIRVLVVDDSAFTRGVLTEILGKAPDIEVVGTARDGLEALEQVAALKPDVMTLDLVMPRLDGVGVLEALNGPQRGRGPRVVVVSVSPEDSELGVRALEAGAMAVVAKPTTLATSRLYTLGGELLDRVREAAWAHHPEVVDSAPLSPVPSWGDLAVDLVVVGASTGGPQALTRLIRDLPADLPVPVALVLHIPPGYTAHFARRVDEQSLLQVIEAEPDLELQPGRVVVARAGEHLKIRREGRRLVCKLDLQPMDHLHRPAVDVLFSSAAQACGGRVLGLVMTGMGSDGREGARDLHAAGGRVLTQAAWSCVIDGMPRSVREAGLSSGEYPLESLAGAIVENLRPR